MRQRLRPAPAEAEVPKRITQLVAQLDDDRFAARERAEKELRQLGGQAREALEAALKGNLSLEAGRRVTRLLAALGLRRLSGEALRQARAVEALERVGTKEARELLQELAGGDRGAVLTAEAAAALRRMGK
jgi:hypothetical protein